MPTDRETISVLEYLLLIAFPAAMAFGGVKDLLTLTIPNRVSLFLVAAFVVAIPVAGMSLHDCAMHLAAGALVLAAGIALFSGGMIGGGDAKLAAAAALWVGFDNLLLYFTQVALLGGGLAVVMLLFRRVPVAALPIPTWALRLHDNAAGIPYGLAIAGGALWVYPQTSLFAAFSV